ncbi:MAG: HEPN domain-containing protein [Syntrophaceae bacterium]|nr:HEPN domain-containing protein [Syntrophaceae bacterium]
MNNFESGKDLLLTAKRIMERDLQEAWKGNDDNMVVRRAQEVVELALKGALKILGVEYPKIHDVGKIFEEMVKKKIGEFDEEVMKRVVRISARLAEDRGPSFYGEKIFKREEAGEAYSDAKFVFDNVVKILKISI